MMPGRRIVGAMEGDSWNLRRYVWRGPCVKVPGFDRNMRAIVAMDTKGKYHPGLRNSYDSGPEDKTTYLEFSSFADRERAIGVAKDMLLYSLDSHEQTEKYIDAGMPDPDSTYGSQDIKRIAWTGPLTDTYDGNLIFGAVGRTKDNSLVAGYASVSSGLFVEQGAGSRENYRWDSKRYQELGHAIFAARRIVKREVDDSYEPDRVEPEEKVASPTALEKAASAVTVEDLPQSRFDALLSKLRMPGLKKGAPSPAKRGRPIDR